MRLLKAAGLGGALLLVSFSIVYADAADDLLRALGTSLPGIEAPAETPPEAEQATSTTVAAPAEVKPMTEAERNAQIDSLRAFILELTKQLQDILAKRAVSAKAAAEAEAKAVEDARFKPETCKPIVRTLSRGHKGEDVRCLQAVLVADKLLEEENATGFFGELTEKAVKQFQIEVGILAVTGSVGPNTRAEANLFLELLAKKDSFATSTLDTLETAMVSFGPQLPVGTDPEDFVILSGEKVDYALRITTQEPAAFSYTIDWADGAVESGVIRSGGFKTVSHTYVAGVYDVQVHARNEKSAGDGTFVIGVNNSGGAGDLLEITSPQAAFKFDVVTLMPVSVQAKDPRVIGSVRIYAQDSPTVRFGTGHFLGEVPLLSAEGSAKFPLTELAAGAYWLQAVGTKFQDCAQGPCKEFIPNHSVGPIEITDQTNFAASQLLPGDVEPGATTTATSTTP